VERITHFLSKICRTPEAAKQMAESKEIVFKVLIYFMAEEIDTFKQCLIVFHSCCHVDGFPEMIEQHKFPDKAFDSYCEKIKRQFEE